MKTPLFLLFSSLVFASSAVGQTPARKPVKRPVLTFQARPTKELFTRGEDVVLILSIRNGSSEPIFVSRLAKDEFVDFKISGPDGRDAPWQGRRRIDSKLYSPSAFAVLASGQKIRAKRVISLKDGQGFVLSKRGPYSVTAVYSLEPPEYFAPLAGETKIPTGSFRSVNTAFCIEVCGPDSQK